MTRITSRFTATVIGTALLLFPFTTSAMPITVRTLTGKVILLDVEPSETIGTVKQKIADKEGIPSNLQRLIFSGKATEDGSTLASHGIAADATLYLVIKSRPD